MSGTLQDPALNAFGRILVVDDDRGFAEALAGALSRAGLAAEPSGDPREALDLLARSDYSLMIADLDMPGLDGLELMRLARSVSPHTEVVIVSGQGSVQSAVEALRAGAADFLGKPSGAEGVWELVGRLTEMRRLRRENRELRSEITRLRRPLLPGSAAMRRTLAAVRELAGSTVPVLLCGEEGSGRDTLARLVHLESGRCAGPLVKADCAALPAGLHEAEIFGGPGSSSGGRLQLASGGTLYLDEITCLSATAQERLLGVLGVPVAGSQGARLVASASRDLGALVRAGRFLPGLRDALSAAAVRIPPLRERPEDVPAYVRNFLERRALPGSPVPAVSSEALDALCRWSWPGNVRELEAAVDRAAALAGGGPVLPAYLPPELRRAAAADGGAGALAGQAAGPAGAPRRLDELERDAIRDTLQRTGGNLSMAAGELGVSRTSLYDRMARYGLTRPARRGRGRRSGEN